MKRFVQMGIVAPMVATIFSGLVGVAADVGAQGDMETYTSPTYGVTFEYDDYIWSPFMESDADVNRGRDLIGLESDDVRGGLIAEVHQDETDADDCLQRLYREGLGDYNEVEPKEDDDDEPIEGSSNGSAWAAYNFVSEGAFASAHLFCQEWGDEEGVIAFLFLVARDGYDDGLELIEPILDSVEAPDDRDADEDEESRADDEDDRDRDDEDEGDDRDREDDEEDDRADEDEDDRDREDDVSDQLADTGIYESPKFGFTVPVNVENWELTGIDANEQNETAAFSGPHREMLDIMTFSHNGAPLHEYPDYYVDSLERKGDVEIELYVDPDKGETIERRRADEVYALYTFELDGSEYLLYLHAVVSDDSGYVVMVVGISLVSSYDLLEEDVFEMLDDIEF